MSIFGDNKKLKEEKAIDDPTLDKNDIAAAANSRYFRRNGVKLLMIWAAVMFLILILTNYISLLPGWLSFILIALSSVIFVWLYSRKQTEVRVRLTHNIDEKIMAQQRKDITDSK
jgi:1,4-dihydroxy-2-naphthoate octaprenyltransferase